MLFIHWTIDYLELCSIILKYLRIYFQINFDIVLKFYFIVVRKYMLYDFILHLLRLNLWLNVAAIFMNISCSLKKIMYSFLGIVFYISVKLSRVSSVNSDFLSAYFINYWIELKSWTINMNSFIFLSVLLVFASYILKLCY